MELSPNRPPLFEDLGRCAYEEALSTQRRIHSDVVEGRRPPTVLFVEHEPVVTITRRPGAADHLLADAARLEAEGVAVCRTDRGGDITYHGPGQLVAYPVVPLDRLGLNVRRYVRMLEEAIIESVAPYGVRAERDACAVGVWVGGAKLAAIGVRIRRWVSMHGLALNVTPDLRHFGLIVPCGLRRPVTSLQRLLGDQAPGMDQVKASLRAALQRRLQVGAASRPLTAEASVR